MPETENRNTHIVAFIDILGFRSLVSDYFSGNNTEALPILENALKAAEEYAVGYCSKYMKRHDMEYTFKQFSDCVSISFRIKAKEAARFLIEFGAVFNIVKMYQYILLGHNIMVRGGVSVGGHVENNNMIFSDALIKSYKLETENAIYPRIIIDKSIIVLLEKALKKSPEEHDNFYDFYGHAMIRDWDDEVFISPFGIVGITKTAIDKLGVDAFIKIISATTSIKVNEIDIDEFVNIIKSDKSDKQTLQSHLGIINKYLKENVNTKPEIILKYKWFKQFILWSIQPKSSQIKFEHHFKKAKKKR